ncbi:MAG: hypothetical protein HQL52_15770 [Magnetococcales bacterium]|nr:hypothetical protein [Magnetococcales bacterium]
MGRKNKAHFDLSHLDTLPGLTLADGAWLAGISPEALGEFLREGDQAGILKVSKDKEGDIPLEDLVRLGFSLLGRKEAQLTMLRLLGEQKAESEAEENSLNTPAGGNAGGGGTSRVSGRDKKSKKAASKGAKGLSAKSGKSKTKTDPSDAKMGKGAKKKKKKGK